MENKTHGPAGAAAGAATNVGLAAFGAPGAVQVGLFIGAVVGGLLPDTDHPASTVARMWGPITSVPCALLGGLAGGHRKGTHDVSKGAPILFGIAFAVALAATTVAPGEVSRRVSFFAVALLTGLTLISLDAVIPGKWTGRPLRNLFVSVVVAWVVADQFPHGLPSLAVVGVGAGVALGALVGGIGLDACTIQGVPWRGRKVHLLPAGMRVRTGSSAERWLFRFPVFVVLAVGLGVWNSAASAGGWPV